MSVTLPTLYQQQKICSRCKAKKDFSKFDKHNQHKDGLHSRCKECRKEEHRVAKQQSGYRDRVRANHFRKTYGISLQERDAIEERQSGLCAICLAVTDKPLHVDHCHDTGVVRGLLCLNCNHGIGKFKDDPATLRRAADYLERTNE